MKRLILISASFLIVSAAFAQSRRCVTTSANVTGDQATITSSGAKSVTENETYIYYERRHHRRHEQANTVAAIPDKYPSQPLMLNSSKSVKAMSEAYNVSLSTPESNVSVCPDSTLNLSANINVEKVSSYTGNYPNSMNDNKEYKKVPKKDYKMAMRKKRQIERKEAKIVRKTHTYVDVKSNNA